MSKRLVHHPSYGKLIEHEFALKRRAASPIKRLEP